MIDIHQANKEVFTGEFDCERERARLQRLAKDDTVEVIEFIDDVAMIASKSGVSLIQLPANQKQPPGTYLVRYWKGKVYNPRFKRQGLPYDFGPYLIKFYHPDRVAEILRKHREAA